jgi:hypothetical protein
VSFATVWHLGDETSRQSASTLGKISSWPDNMDPPALQLLHIPGGADLVVPCCDPRWGRHWDAGSRALGHVGQSLLPRYPRGRDAPLGRAG